MNKLVIPTILIATVLVAGFFAILPIEKASTVHTTIISDAADNTTTRVVDADQTDFAAGDSMEVTCTGGASLVRAIAFETAGGAGFDTGDNMSLKFDVDGAGGNAWTEVTLNGDIFGDQAPIDTEILERAGIVAPIPLTSAGTVTIDFDTSASPAGNTVRAMFIIDVDGSTTCAATGTTSN